MKKYGLITLSTICVIALFAQKKINIYKSDFKIVGFAVSMIDSMMFSDNDTVLNIYKMDKSITSLPVSSIDSVTFTEIESIDLPAVKTVAATSVSYTTAKCGVKINATGSSSITEKGICWSTTENPTTDNSKTVSGSSADSSSVSMTGLMANTTYYVRSYATNSIGTSYGEQITFTTLSYSLPVVETTSATYDYGTNKARCLVNVKSNGGCSLTERGICWSTSQNPTISDNKFSSGISVGQFYAQTSNLSLNGTYYVRAFATNCVGTSYGAQLTVKALMGNVTYTLDIDPVANPEPYRLIKIAMDSACYYYNRYTTFSAKIYVYYNAGIPTAQASYRGSIGFGPNTRYMWVGTAMHEMAHYMGSGTTTKWQSFTTTGTYTGATASALLKTLTGETLKGDKMHFWPYGINQKEEVTSANDLIVHAKIVNAMKTDCGW